MKLTRVKVSREEILKTLHNFGATLYSSQHGNIPETIELNAEVVEEKKCTVNHCVGCKNPNNKCYCPCHSKSEIARENKLKIFSCPNKECDRTYEAYEIDQKSMCGQCGTYIIPRVAPAQKIEPLGTIMGTNIRGTYATTWAINEDGMNQIRNKLNELINHINSYVR